MKKYKNIKGNKSGLLTAIECTFEKDKDRSYLWKCKCDCGNEVLISAGHFKYYKSCGCLQPSHKNYKPKDKTITSNGYVMIRNEQHARQHKNKRVFEHILVMEQILNRSLLPNEEVHHKNGNRQDNRPENLELWSTSQPCGQRVKDKIEWAKEILETYKNY